MKFGSGCGKGLIKVKLKNSHSILIRDLRIEKKSQLQDRKI